MQTKWVNFALEMRIFMQLKRHFATFLVHFATFCTGFLG